MPTPIGTLFHAHTQVVVSKGSRHSFVKRLAIFARFGIGVLISLMALFVLPSSLWAIGPLKTVAVGHTPGPIAVNTSTHTIYVVNRADNTVSAIDSQRLTVKATIPIGSGGSAIAVNPLTNIVYVANSISGTITGILGTRAVGTVPVGGKPVALAVDAALNQVYVADAQRDEIEVLNATKGTVLAILPTSLQPTSMAVDIATHSLFVTCTGNSGSVVVIDGVHNQILTTVGSLPTGLTSIALDPETNVTMSVSPTANDIVVIDAANGYAVQIVPAEIGAFPIVTAFDPGGTGLFFEADSGDGNIFFAGGDGKITLGDAFFTGEQGAGALAVSPTSNQIALVYPAGDFAFIINLLNPLFTQNYFLVDTGLNPTQVAFDPLTNRVFTSNAGDNTISVIDVTPGTETPAYEGEFGGNSIGYNYIDSNPATGITYTLRVNNLFAINEAEAGAGANGQGQNNAGVTQIALQSFYSSAVAVNVATNKIYVGDSVGLFYSVDGSTNVPTLITSVPSSADIRALAVDSATNEIVAWDYYGHFYILDSTTDTVLKTIPSTTAGLLTLLVDPAKNLAYGVSDNVYVIDPAAGSIVSTVPLSGVTLSAALNPGTHRLYAVTNDTHLYIVDTNQNTVVKTITLPNSADAVAVNSITGNYYLGINESSGWHVLVYSGTTNTLLFDLAASQYPQLSEAVEIVPNPLTNAMYVATDSGSQTSLVAVIDGLTSAVSALPPSPYESAAHSLSVDLATGLLAGAGYSYTTLWFATADSSGETETPISMGFQGVQDSQTIATKPIFRTRNTTPSFFISATGNFTGGGASLVPKQAFYQVDGEQGNWTPVPLTLKSGTTTGYAKVTMPRLANGRHILYAYASVGDVATVQDGISGGNSPVIGPIGAVVFTVEK